jgi:hypothetical protein
VIASDLMAASRSSWPTCGPTTSSFEISAFGSIDVRMFMNFGRNTSAVSPVDGRRMVMSRVEPKVETCGSW